MTGGVPKAFSPGVRFESEKALPAKTCHLMQSKLSAGWRWAEESGGLCREEFWLKLTLWKFYLSSCK